MTNKSENIYNFNEKFNYKKEQLDIKKNANLINDKNYILNNNDKKNNIIVQKTSNYKLSYYSLLKNLNIRISKLYNKENEYYCNILLMPSTIQLSNKIPILHFLTNLYKENNKPELIIQLLKNVKNIFLIILKLTLFFC